MSEMAHIRALAEAQAALQQRLDDLARIEGSRAIAARYTTNAGQSIANSTATTVNFKDVVYDPLGLVTPGVGWIFSCPRAGNYLVTAGILFNTFGWTIGQVRRLDLFKNGTIWTYLDRDDGDVDYGYVSGSDIVTCAAGDTLRIGALQTSGGTRTLFPDGLHNYVAIARIP